ncbi:MAG: thioesterase [Treponema sp.]|nr:thioesterase [Treponema sp.]
MENYLDKKYELRYFEMDKYGALSPTTVLTLLEETAAEHCYDIGYSLYGLEKQNIGWVLISGTIDMLRYPRYKEKIAIRTWISKYTLVKGHRENIIFDDAGNVIGRAQGIWVFYDIEKKKPVPIFDDIKSKWGVNQQVSQGVDMDAIKIIDGGVEHQIEYDVHKSDVDSNKHVNNIRYFHWLMESLPGDILDDYVLKRVNAKFYAEAKYGEKIRVNIESEKGRNAFLHTMRSSRDNRLLAAAHTVLEKRAANF